MKQNLTTIDSMIEDFKNTESTDKKGGFTDEFEQLNLWIPRKSKEDFLELQKSSRKRFGKMLQKLIVTAIQKAKT